MREAYFAHVDFPPDANVVEVGCGPGPVARALAAWPGVGEAVGVDPSPVFIAKAREFGADLPNLTFVEGDARALPLEDGAVRRPRLPHDALSRPRAPRLRSPRRCGSFAPGGLLAVFDGDYATATCALGDFDPLQICVEACVDYLVHDRWLVRRLSKLVREAGFEIVRFGSHSYVEAPSSGGYMLAIVDRGADALVATGIVASAPPRR